MNHLAGLLKDRVEIVDDDDAAGEQFVGQFAHGRAVRADGVDMHLLRQR